MIASWGGRPLTGMARTAYSWLPEPVRARVRHPLRRLRLLNSPSVAPFLDFAPPGHFYSPIPSLPEVEARASARAAQARAVGEIDLRAEAQLALFHELARAVGGDRLPRRPVPHLRYHTDDYFGEADATLYLGLLRLLRPRRVVEVGSGFSSALLLDVAEAELPGLRATFIEPEPERLRSLLRPGDGTSVEIIERPVQEVPMERFTALEAGDILFVDSSHVAKFGSDVCHLIGDVLPELAPGVVIHFHDVFWPFEYPVDWLRFGRAWNEAYVLRAFLQNNVRYEILFFEDWFVGSHPALVEAHLPQLGLPNSGSLWLRKAG